MKNLYKFFSIFFCICIFCTKIIAQTTLSPGDLAITGFNSDNTLSSKDEISCVLLVDVDAGTLIKFTDNGYNSISGLRNTEGTLSWTTGTAISAGTELLFQDDILGAGWTVNHGSVTEKGSFILSTSGDQILVYQGNIISPTFIFAVHCNGSTGWDFIGNTSNTSALPLGLTDNTNAMALKEYDNFVYSCTIVNGTAAEILAGVVNTANWDGHNTTTNILANCTFGIPATYYVNAATGNDANNGSSGSPWLTLTYAISQVSSSVADQINVASGTYSEDNITCSKSVTIVGAGSTSTVFDGDSTNRFLNISANNIIIKNCKIKEYQNASAGGGAILVTGAFTGIEFENVEFVNNTCPTINSGGGAIDLATSSSTTIKRCKFYGNRAVYNNAAGGGTRGGAIRGYGTNITLNVYSSLFYENVVGYFGPGIHFYGTNSNILFHNTLNIYNSTFADHNCLFNSTLGAAPINGLYTTIKAHNTLCYDNKYNDNSTVGNDFYDNLGTSNLYNCHVSSSGNYSGINTVINITFGDPAFYSSINDDYSLSGSSPCINKGNNAYWPAVGDINTGSYQTTADLGCFEYCLSATWDGSAGTTFGTASNWNTNHPRCHNLTIANVTNDPIVGDESLTVHGNLTINSGASLTVNSNVSGAYLEVAGTFTNSGTFTHSGSATLKFTGTTNQTLNTGGATLNNVEVNNSSGVTLGGLTTISGTLTLTSGGINTSGNILALTSTTASDFSGYSSSNFITATSAAGALRRYIGTNTESYAYPVGIGANTTDYYRMDLDNNNLSGMTYLDVYIKRNTETGNNQSQYGGATEDGTGLYYYSKEEWVMTPNLAPGSGSFGLKLWLANVILGASGILQDNKFTIVKRSTASENFVDYDSFDGTTTIPAGGQVGRTVAGGYALKNGFTGFSKAGVGGSNDPLPIELVEFTAGFNSENDVDLSWITASEINNDYFTVERSRDAEDFDMIVTVLGAGNSNEMLYYESTDENPLLGISYYRLKQTDYDGDFSYSKIEVVKNLKELNFSITPNPATDYLTVTFGKVKGNTVFVMTPDYQTEIKIYNGAGVLAYKKVFDGTFYKYPIDVTKLPEGMYYIKMKANNQLYNSSFIKQ